MRVRVRLSGREASQLFLRGDVLIQLPLEGSFADDDGVALARSSIFLSELAGSRDGLTRVFRDEPAAAAFGTSVRTQLETALEAP